MVPAPLAIIGLFTNRFAQWRKAGVCQRLFDAILQVHDGNLIMIDNSYVRVHQQGANPKEIMQYMGHSTISVTHDLYGNLFPDDGSYEQAVNQAMEGLLGTKLVQS